MHRTPIEVRWGELDPYHHVNHAAYLSYMEHARVAVLDAAGWGMEELTSRGYMVLVVRVDVKFVRPAAAGDRLEVHTGVIEMGASRSTWSQVIVRGEEKLVTAEVQAAFTDLEGRPVRAPDDLRDALKRVAGPDTGSPNI